MAANIKQDIHAVLKKYWGFQSFRPLQEDIVTAALNGHDTLALLPTGGGKSLCFQVPGLCLEGITLVVSPLISLMNDQVSNLIKKGIPAVALSAAMAPREIDNSLNSAAYGHTRFIYLSPERLQNEHFRQKLSHLPVKLIAVDEAHCISQWGYDFRPSYLRIAELREFFPGVAVLALTASATGAVTDDIQKQLLFKNQKVFRQSFARRNLRYVVQHEENKFSRLCKIIQNVGGAGVVYVRNRRKTEELAKTLTASGVGALPYHAGLKYEDRREVQQQWIDNKTKVIVATNAFGMGIDKPDARYVVHLDLPESLEAYFQEAGRAGRDGETAYAVMLFSEADRERLKESFTRSYPEIDQIRRVYQSICNYYQIAIGSGEGFITEFDAERVCASYGLPTSMVYNSIRFLEKQGYVSLIDGAVEPSKLMITCSKQQLYEFELRHPKLEPLIKTLLRSYGGLFEGYVQISERELALRAKAGVSDVSANLVKLQKEQLLSYLPQSGLPKLLFLQNRVDAKYLYFDPQNYTRLKENARVRMNSVLSYTENDRLCRQSQLLAYFGEESVEACGYCDVCIAGKPKNRRSLKERILKLFSDGDHTLDEVREKMSRYRDESWISAFNEMVDDGVLRESGAGYGLSDRKRQP